MCLGGSILSHDNRMIDFYWHLLGPERTARVLSTIDKPIRASDTEALLYDFDRLPSMGYAEISRVATPLIVHSKGLRDRLREETGTSVVDLPFVPYRRPTVECIDEQVRRTARSRQAIDDNVINVATFGIVDARTKGTDVIADVVAWLQLWNVPVRLHYVGAAPPGERRLLEDFAVKTGVQDLLVFHDHLDPSDYSDMLLAVDMAVQLRTGPVLTLSGALLDCIAFGVPTIATRSTANEVDAPSYVTTIADQISPLLIAEAIVMNAYRRRDALDDIESERVTYLANRSASRYAVAVLDHMGLRAGATC